jgi:hypothetical protein
MEGDDFCSPYGKLIFLRYLCEGKYGAGTGRQISYDEIPWGEVYYQNFRGRCVSRLARTFGKEAADLERVMETSAKLRAERLAQGDAGYRFEFVNGLYMSMMVWEGDDEFPASAQILFSDNFAGAFTAEDIAAAAEFAVGYLAALLNEPPRRCAPPLLGGEYINRGSPKAASPTGKPASVKNGRQDAAPTDALTTVLQGTVKPLKGDDCDA